MLNLSPAKEVDSLSMMFWNLENFFDWIDEGGGESDAEFSSFGSRHWSKGKFEEKCEAISKAVYWVAGEEGSIPDVIGVAEVENRFVLWKLLEDTALRKCGYEIVHYESYDHRGIDVGLLYRHSELKLLESKPVRTDAPQGRDLATRDMLLCQFETASGASKLSVVVCHHPSKYGGGDTDWKRKAVVQRLGQLCDSLMRAGEENVVVMGDFNDTPYNPILAHMSPPLHNLAKPLSDRGVGSIRYDGRWELIDMFLVTEAISCSRMSVLRIPFLVTHDKAHGGEKPLRTFSGPRHVGGVSDHLPILLRIPIR